MLTRFAEAATAKPAASLAGKWFASTCQGCTAWCPVQVRVLGNRVVEARAGHAHPGPTLEAAAGPSPHGRTSAAERARPQPELVDSGELFFREDRLDPRAALVPEPLVRVTPLLHPCHDLAPADLARPQPGAEVLHLGHLGNPALDALPPNHLELGDLILRQLEPIPHLHDRLDVRTRRPSPAANLFLFLPTDLYGADRDQRAKDEPASSRPSHRLHSSTHLSIPAAVSPPLMESMPFGSGPLKVPAARRLGHGPLLDASSSRNTAAESARDVRR